MTQKQLNKLWKKVEEAEDYDEALEEYWKRLDRMGIVASTATGKSTEPLSRSSPT